MKFMIQIQPYHLVTISPWPLLMSLNMLSSFMSLIIMFSLKLKILSMFNLLTSILIAYQWWRDVIRESTFQGYHPSKVEHGMKLGMILFIISELFFFISFFWSYFHMMLGPSIEINSWPPYKLNNFMIDPYYLPLLNTIILVSSGMFLTMAHYSLMMKNFNKTMIMMIYTILFGLIFSFIQLEEYKDSLFSIYSSTYGSTFFMMTGFHGLHVLIGTILIIMTFLRIMFYQLSNKHHFGFEASAWYWHFVDVIWLFLFLFVYWWPF